MIHVDKLKEIAIPADPVKLQLFHLQTTLGLCNQLVRFYEKRLEKLDSLDEIIDTMIEYLNKLKIKDK